jgi:hypothetical protein
MTEICVGTPDLIVLLGGESVLSELEGNSKLKKALLRAK